jgi:amino acid permease
MFLFVLKRNFLFWHATDYKSLEVYQIHLNYVQKYQHHQMNDPLNKVINGARSISLFWFFWIFSIIVLPGEGSIADVAEKIEQNIGLLKAINQVYRNERYQFPCAKNLQVCYGQS